MAEEPTDKERIAALETLLHYQFVSFNGVLNGFYRNDESKQDQFKKLLRQAAQEYDDKGEHGIATAMRNIINGSIAEGK